MPHVGVQVRDAVDHFQYRLENGFIFGLVFEVYIFIVWLRVLDLRLGFGFEALTFSVIFWFLI